MRSALFGRCILFNRSELRIRFLVVKLYFVEILESDELGAEFHKIHLSDNRGAFDRSKQHHLM
jgi:hypothetical protein